MNRTPSCEEALRRLVDAVSRRRALTPALSVRLRGAARAAAVRRADIELGEALTAARALLGQQAA